MTVAAINGACAGAGLSLALGAFVSGIIVSESDLSHQAAGEIIRNSLTHVARGADGVAAVAVQVTAMGSNAPSKVRIWTPGQQKSEVVVKVQRPDAPLQVESDLQLMRSAARVVRECVRSLDFIDSEALVDEFAAHVFRDVPVVFHQQDPHSARPAAPCVKKLSLSQRPESLTVRCALAKPEAVADVLSSA